jgi:hypothetical protein
MYEKEEKQAQLITINNLCSNLTVTIEKHYTTPNAAELLGLIETLMEECEKYLKALQS